MPRAASFTPPAAAAAPDDVAPSTRATPAHSTGTPPRRDRIVYFPSCAARSMGPARGDAEGEPLPVVADRLLRRAGYEVVYPEGIGGLCCGQPFESKGLAGSADAKSAELERSLREASDGGACPIVFDTSPCAYRMKRVLQGRLPVLDVTELLHDHVLPRLTLTKRPGAIAVHPVCSVREQGLEGKLERVAAACAEVVVVPTGVGCCGWAGDRGFTVPELNAHALRDLAPSLPPGCAAGYSTSRTCEIGLAHHSGIPYRSIVALVEACSG